MEKYNLTRRRNMKNLRLRVKSDGQVYVSAPYGVPLSVIEGFVESRTQWIAQQREKLSEAPVPAAELSDGSVITVFGRQLVICVTAGEGEAFSEGGRLIVPLGTDNSIETSVLGFMGKQCRKYCTEAVKIYLDRAGYKGAPVNIDFKLLKSRWGSYNRQKNLITFNLALCKLEDRFINYVAAHEVTHIFVHNHSADFYKFGETIFEDFLKTDRELNKIRIGGFFS